jgi:hypothetical protein
VTRVILAGALLTAATLGLRAVTMHADPGCKPYPDNSSRLYCPTAPLLPTPPPNPGPTMPPKVVP